MTSWTQFDDCPISNLPPIRFRRHVLKQIADVIAPFIVDMFNRSLSEGHFPAAFKDRGVYYSGHEETGT